jgi:hypothetical protein
MADESHDERLRRHQEMLEGLAKVWGRQGEINDRLDTAIEALQTFNRQQVEINADVKTTLARLETLMTRVFRGDAGNGQEA